MKDERVTITPYKDGPLLVRGAVELVAPNGDPIATNRKTVALCRCGLSTIKPFCDGTHRATGFTTDDCGAESEPSCPCGRALSAPQLLR